MTPEPEYPHIDLIEVSRGYAHQLRQQAEEIQDADPAKAEALQKMAYDATVSGEQHRTDLIRQNRTP
jgi:hypothetical protein